MNRKTWRLVCSLGRICICAAGYSQKGTFLAEHVNGYREGCLRYLCGRDEVNGGRVFYIAMHHYKPCLRDAVQRSKEERSSIRRFRCTKEEAEETELTVEDICKDQFPENSIDLEYYVLPTIRDLEVVKRELEEAKALTLLLMQC